MGAPAFDQLAFRLRNDDGSITAATYMGSGNNENQTIDWDVPFRIRFVIDEYNAKTAIITPNLYINYNGGGWEDIATCLEVDWATSAYVSDGTVISVEELGTTPSDGAFNNGEYDQNGTVAPWTLAAKGDYSEFEFCLTIDSASATDGHTFQLRVYNGAAALDLYTNEPTITVNATVSDVNVYPVAVAAGADSVNPTTQLGDIDFTPAVDAAGADSINPTVQLGDVSFTPAVGAAGADSIAPSVQQDSMNVTPAILSAGADSVNPTTQHGSINITPAVCAAGADSIDPTVTIGSPPINITPPALTAGADSVVGEVRQGPVTITPAVSVAGADSIDPTTNQGDIDLTPTVVSGAAVSIDPSVLQDSMDVTPAVLAAGADSLLGETRQDSLDITPAVSSASVTIVEPSVEQDSMDVTPAVAAAGADSIDPSVQIGSPPIYPDPVVAGADSVLGEVRQGSINITPAVDSAGSDSIDPSITLSSVSVTPGVAASGADSVDPTVQILGGGEDVYPAAVTAAASTVDPSIGLSSTSASPPASSAGTDTSVLTVRYGNVSITPAIDTAGTDGFHTETRLGSISIVAGRVVAVTFETGDLSEFDQVWDAGNDLDVNTDAALDGTYGMEIDTTGQPTPFGRVDFTSEDRIFGSFRVDPNSLAMAIADLFPILVLYNTANMPSVSIQMRKRIEGYRLVCFIIDDDQVYYSTGEQVISDAPHLCEFEYKQATGPGADDGFLRIWIDGSYSEEVGINNDEKDVRRVDFGITYGLDVGTSGTFYLDSLEIFTPDAFSASVESVDPIVNIQENFINITPAPAVAGADSVDPTVHQGDLDLSPAVSQAAASAVLADVTQDSIDVYPAAGAAGTATVDPLISISGGNFVAVSWARIRIPASGINVTPRPASARTNTEGNVKVTIQTSSVIITVTAPTIDLTQIHVLTVTSGVIGITSDTVVLAQEHQLLVHRAVINVTAQTIQLGFPILYPLIKDGAVNSGISKDLEVNSAIIGVGNVTSRLIVEGEVNSRIEADLEITERLEVPNGS